MNKYNDMAKYEIYLIINKTIYFYKIKIIKCQISL